MEGISESEKLVERWGLPLRSWLELKGIERPEAEMMVRRIFKTLPADFSAENDESSKALFVEARKLLEQRRRGTLTHEEDGEKSAADQFRFPVTEGKSDRAANWVNRVLGKKTPLAIRPSAPRLVEAITSPAPDEKNIQRLVEDAMRRLLPDLLPGLVDALISDRLALLEKKLQARESAETARQNAKLIADEVLERLPALFSMKLLQDGMLPGLNRRVPEICLKDPSLDQEEKKLETVVKELSPDSAAADPSEGLEATADSEAKRIAADNLEGIIEHIAEQNLKMDDGD